MSARWRALEEIPGLAALLPVWRRRVGDQFESFQTLCLQVHPKPATLYPCPYATGCAYRICHQADKSILGLCETQSAYCPEKKFTAEDVTPLQLSWSRLGRAIAKAFGLNPRTADFGIPNTIQFGTYSADCVPAILTIQTERHIMRRVVAELVARLNAPFILFAPTSDLMDARSQELLTRVKAGFFPLDSNVLLTENGTLQPIKAPGEMLARFTPEPKTPLDEDTAQRAFALVNRFDRKIRLPSLITIFRMYCMNELSAEAISKKCDCSKAAVIRRLKMIREITGSAPIELRRFSPHFQKLESSLNDTRASHIHRENFLGEVEGDENAG
jgi:hypothetical protein